MNNIKYNNILINTITILLSIVFIIKFIALCDGDVINHYPFITSDGFDWYVEGIFIDSYFKGYVISPLNVLRPPIFVLICYLDYKLGGAGLIIGPLLASTFVINYFILCKILDDKFVGNQKVFLRILIIICIFLLPINYIKPYILADSIAITISLISFYALNSYHETKKSIFIISGVLSTIIAALTQNYAGIPGLIAISYICYIKYKKNGSFPFKDIACLALIVISIFLISFFWRSIIPHHQTPTNFGLLKFSMNMYEFYSKTWIYFYAPFIILLIFAKFNDKKLSFNYVLILIFLIFNILIFFYQWPETRFTAYGWYFGLIFMLIIFNKDKIKYLKYICILFLFISVTGTSNYWVLSKENIRFSYRGSWVYEFMKSKSLNRNFNNIDTSAYFQKSDDYTKKTIEMYNLLLNIKK